MKNLDPGNVDIDTVRLAIGNFETDFIVLSQKQEKYFSFFNVRFSNIVKGIPRDWFFAVLNLTIEEASNFKSLAFRKKVVDRATHLTNFCQRLSRPIIFINRYSEIGTFKQALPYQKNHIFVVEHLRLGKPLQRIRDIRNAPFFIEIISRFRADEIPVPFLSPYIPGDPAEGWRFFGRRKEVESLETESNVLLFGGRKLGKSSIVLEFQRRAEERGETVYYIDCQNLKSTSTLVQQIIGQLDQKVAYRINRDSSKLGLDYTSQLLKAFKKKNERPVLIFDEIGNVLKHEGFKHEGWGSVIGALRQITQQGHLKAIFTAFHEVIDRQLKDHESAFHNFGIVIKLRPFSHSEVEELLVEPLIFWMGNNVDKREITDLIVNRVSSHPFILGYLGQFLFERIFKPGNKNLITLINEFLSPGELKRTMGPIIEQVYDSDTTPLMRVVYLHSCFIAEKRVDTGKAFSSVTISDADVKSVLRDIGIELSLDQMLVLFKKIELRGWVVLSEYSERSYHIVTRIIFEYLKKVRAPITDYINEDVKKLRQEYSEIREYLI